MQQRMTKNSTANIQLAQKFIFVKDESGPGWMIEMRNGSKVAYAYGSTGPIVYKTKRLAQRAIERLRPGVTITDL